MMLFLLRFFDGEEQCIERYGSLELALEAACDLTARGYEVHSIDRGPLAYPIVREAIAHIYEIWVRERYLRGIRL